MNAATLENVSARADTTARPGSDWFAIGVFALVWLELISRLRLEWSTPRNGSHHRKFMALVQLVTENSEIYDPSAYRI